jgi:mono/diheme cytochrome c family protein
MAYIDSGCARCHGGGLSGSKLGPSLRGLQSDWRKEELVKFLKAPNAYKLQDERLQTIAKRYRVPMPAFSMDDKSREILADYLLEQSK